MMVARRSRGKGSLFWHEKRQQWIGVVSQGYAPNGKRRTTWVSGRTKTEAKAKLDACVRRCRTTHRCTYRGTEALTWSRLALDGDANAIPTNAAEHSALAFRTGEWRDKDEAIPPNLGAAGAVRRRAPRAPAPPADSTNSDGGAVGGQRSGVRHLVRHRARRRECAACVPVSGGGGRLGGFSVDAPRVAAQFRLAALELRRGDRGHRSPRGPCQHERH
jgi:hypothetical protein